MPVPGLLKRLQRLASRHPAVSVPQWLLAAVELRMGPPGPRPCPDPPWLARMRSALDPASRSETGASPPADSQNFSSQGKAVLTLYPAGGPHRGFADPECLQTGALPGPNTRSIAHTPQQIAPAGLPQPARAEPDLPGALEKALQVSNCAPEDLLGALLQAARLAGQERKEGPRAGRSGRRSEPAVYTPYALTVALSAGLGLEQAPLLDPSCGAGAFLVAAFERFFSLRIGTGLSPLESARQVLSRDLLGVEIDSQALWAAEFELRLAAWRRAGLAEDLELGLRCQDALEGLDDLRGQVAAVLGNPPFVEGRGLAVERLATLRERFRAAWGGKVNLGAVFVERSLELLRPGGTLRLILPAPLLRNDRYLGLRRLLLEQTVEEIRPLPQEVFGDRSVETLVLACRKAAPVPGQVVVTPGGAIEQGRLAQGPGLKFAIRTSPRMREVIECLESGGSPLGQWFEVRDGISTGFQPFPRRLLGRVEGGWFLNGEGDRQCFEAGRHKRIIDGAEFHRFTPVRWAGRWIDYDKRHEHTPPHPGRPFNCQLRDSGLYDRPVKLLTRQTARGLIATLDRERYFVRNSVHVTYAREAAGKLGAAKAGERVRQAERTGLLPWGEMGGETATPLSLPALCVCLNSALYEEYYLAVSGEDGKVYPQVHIATLRSLPVLPELLQAGGDLERLGLKILAESAALEAEREKPHAAEQAQKVQGLLEEAEALLAERLGVETLDSRG